VAVSQGSRALEAFAARMAGKYGPEKISNGPPAIIVPTSSVYIDWALRVGGLQLGRVYEILGPKDSAKSTLGIGAMIQHLLMFENRGVGYVNLEGTFDPKRSTAMGLDCSKAAKKAGRWFPMLADTSEEASDMSRDLIASGLVSCIVIDSIGAMESKRVLDKTAEKAADDGRRNASVITKLTKALSTGARNNQCTVILINQPRANQTGMGGDVSAGPKAMQHSTTAKIEMRPQLGEEDTRKIKADGDPTPELVSHKVVARVSRMKNGLAGRVAEPWVNRVASVPYGPPGWDDADSYLTIGTRENIIKLGGSYYTFPDGERVNGRLAAAAYLRANPDACKAIRAEIRFDAPTDPAEEI
jgi:RecA/RadA recombinase